MSNDTYLTIVYRGIQAGDEARALTEHPKASVLAWGHQLLKRDILQETVDCQAAEIASLKAALEHSQRAGGTQQQPGDQMARLRELSALDDRINALRDKRDTLLRLIAESHAGTTGSAA
jgi:hypothetical protein